MISIYSPLYSTSYTVKQISKLMIPDSCIKWRLASPDIVFC